MIDGGVGIAAVVSIGSKYIERSKFTARHDASCDKEADKTLKLAERFDRIPQEDVDHFEFQEYNTLHSRSMEDLRHYRNVQEEYKGKEWFKEPLEKLHIRGRVRHAKRSLQSSNSREERHLHDLETYSRASSSCGSQVNSCYNSESDSGLDLGRFSRPYRTDSCSIRALGGSPPSASLEDICSEEKKAQVVVDVSAWLSSAEMDIDPTDTPSILSIDQSYPTEFSEQDYNSASFVMPMPPIITESSDQTAKHRPSKFPEVEEMRFKSVLRPPKLAPSAWQLYFTDWIRKWQASGMPKLNVAQATKEAHQEYACLSPAEKEPYNQRSQAMMEARKQEQEAYMGTLTPDERGNLLRAAQCKAGKSRQSNLKDTNAPKRPMSAYFKFLQQIRASPLLVADIFGDETETTKQSVLAAVKWRSMTDAERQPFLAQAEQEKMEYEVARRMYEDSKTGFSSSINFSIEPGSPDFPMKTESESESLGFTSDEHSEQDHWHNYASFNMEESDANSVEPECSHCHTLHTSVWRRSKAGDLLCNACGVYGRLRGKPRPLKRIKVRQRSKHVVKNKS